MHPHFGFFDILALIGGMFLYGIRAAVGKWLVTTTFHLLRRLLVRSEAEVRLYQEFVAEELKKKHHSK